MIPTAFKLVSGGLKGLSIPWALVLALSLFVGTQTYRLSQSKEEGKALSWKAAALEKEVQLSRGRADQATSALKSALEANKALEKAYKAAKDRANRKTAESSKKASMSSVEACRDAYEVIHASIYR